MPEDVSANWLRVILRVSAAEEKVAKSSGSGTLGGLSRSQRLNTASTAAARPPIPMMTDRPRRYHGERPTSADAAIAPRFLAHRLVPDLRAWVRPCWARHTQV